MNPTINKSQLMKRAWNIFRGNNPYSWSFSESLRRAWFVEKDNIRYEAEKAEKARKAAERAARQPIEIDNRSEAYIKGMMQFYSDMPQNAYYGD